MSTTVFIPGIPKNANARSQWAKHAANRDRKKFREAAKELGEQLIAAGYQQQKFTRITARHISPYRRRRDPTGLAERLKGILDGLVDAKVLPDDSENDIELILARSAKGEIAGIHLTLEPAQPI